MAADRGRADEAHALDIGVLEEDLGLVARAGHEVDDALGQSRFLPKFHDPHADSGTSPA